jgi:L-fucose isomerase-like protein
MLLHHLKMKNTTIAAVLPVGELDVVLIKNKFDAILQTIDLMGMDWVAAAPVSDEENARQSVKMLLEKKPDILIIIPLRGLSAQVIEAAALVSQVPCLVCPIEAGFALPSSALAVGALHAANFPVQLLYAPPDHPEFSRRLRTVSRASRALLQLTSSRIGIIGGLFPNLVSCRYDPQIVASRLGVTLIPISFETVRNSIQSMGGNSQGVEQARQEITNSYQVSVQDGNALSAGIKLHLVLKQLALEQAIHGFATECWSAFPKELGLNPCLGFIEDAYTIACEGDVLLCAALLMVRYLTGSSAYAGDLYELDLDGVLTLVHCGGPASIARDKSRLVVGRSQLALERGFETITCRPELEQGPVTVFRLYGQECDQLHLASGELLGSEQSPSLKVRVRVNGDRWDFLDQCFGNHYVVVAGDIRDELRLLCKWLKITISET